MASGTTLPQEHWVGIQSILGWDSECFTLAFGHSGLALGTLDPQNEISNKQSKCGGRDNNATGILWADRHWKHIGLAFGLLGIGNTGQAFGKLNSENEIPTKKNQNVPAGTTMLREHWVGIQSILGWDSECSTLAFGQLWVGIGNTQLTK